MRLRFRLALGLGSLLAVISTSGALATTPAALWHMDEKSGTTMVDATGHGHNGTIQNVKLGVTGVSGTGYEFNGSSSRVIVRDGSGLDAGTANFSFTVHVAFTSVPSDDYDLVRKGLQSTSGGDWKMEIINVSGQARAKCFWRGSAGSKTKTAGPNLADGRYHTITCTRTSTTVSLVIDGTSFTSNANVGKIDNSADLTIGAKSGSGGDWYKGKMDEVSLVIG